MVVSAMGYKKHWHHGHHRNTAPKITKDDVIKWTVIFIVFTVVYIFNLITGFFSNCVFEWPPRWDVNTCWQEQHEPAKQKATETVAPLI
jgi:hypothetical protein